MKHKFLFLAVLGLATALMSCEPQMALYPLHTAEDKIFDEQLLGEWRQVDPEEKTVKDNESSLSIVRAEDGLSYIVTLPVPKGKDEAGLASTARLVKLGDFLFLDFKAPDDKDLKFNFYPYPVVESHVFARVRADKKNLRLDFLSDDWVKKQLKDGKSALATLAVDSGLLVTATTAELRKFALAHAEDEEAFSERFEFARAK
ncbi:MAG: hypothetical protein LAN71_00830 [Acidobacteriia bacterium]|nr:hypothetical protein [Terriglobia bacterium]